MKIITRNGWFGPGGLRVDRQEPWVTPQEISDELFPVIPSTMIIVVPPKGYRFKDGVTADNWPVKADLVKLEDGEEEPLQDTPKMQQPDVDSQKSVQDIRERLKKASAGVS